LGSDSHPRWSKQARDGPCAGFRGLVAPLCDVAEHTATFESFAIVEPVSTRIECDALLAMDDTPVR
jgi:hypothetical protein